MSKTFTFDEASLSREFGNTLQQLLGTEKQLGADAAAQLQTLATELTPLLLSLAQERLKAPDPAAIDEYIVGLKAIAAAKLAQLGLEALAAHREMIQQELVRWVGIIASLIMAAV